MNKSLSLRLKEERKRLRISQAEAASRSGVQRETWSRYENGLLQPGTDVWVALSLMGADIRYILSGEREPVFSDTELSQNEKALVALYRGLEGEARNTLMDLLGVIVKTGAEAAVPQPPAEEPAPEKKKPMRKIPKMRSGGPVERVPPIMRSGEVADKKPPRKIRKGDA